MPLLRGKAFPGKRLRQGLELLRFQPIHWARMGCAMHTGIDPLTPAMGLPIEVIEISEQHATPKALLHIADRSFHFAFGLRRVRLTDPRRDSNGDHEVGKAGIPAWFVLLHFQQHAFHAVGQRAFRQAPKILKRLHQRANERRGITALHKRHEAHARIAQHGGKPIEFMGHPLLLIDKLAPIKLDLSPWLGLIALHWCMARHRRAQRMHEFLENTDPSGVAHLL